MIARRRFRHRDTACGKVTKLAASIYLARWKENRRKGATKYDEERKKTSKHLLLLGCLLSGLRDFSSSLVGLVDGLDDTNGDSLSHVTDGETTKRWIFVVGLDAHGLAWNKLGDASITGLDEFGAGFDRLASTTIDLLNELSELASNVGGVAIQDGSVTSTDLTWVVEYDDLSVEGGGFFRGVVLGVRSDVATANILDRDVLDVETDVVTRETLLKLLVMHFDGLDFGGDVGGSEGNKHTSLDDTGFDTTDGHRADTTDLVDILKGKTEGLVGWTDWGFNGIDGIEKGLALDNTALGLLSPALVPWHVSGILQHVITVPARDGNESDSLGVITNLLDETGSFLDDFVETILAPFGGVHLVDGDNKLPNTEGEGKESVLASLTILRDTSFELTSTGGDDEDSTISLRGTGDHVLDEISVTRSVDDSNHELRGLEFPESDIDGDTTLTLSLELVEHPSILEGTLAEFSGFFLELLDGTLIDTTALVD